MEVVYGEVGGGGAKEEAQTERGGSGGLSGEEMVVREVEPKVR